jgi:hypothetical protein
LENRFGGIHRPFLVAARNVANDLLRGTASRNRLVAPRSSLVAPN